MNKAVIFDLNGVFIQSPPLSKRIESDYGILESVFLPVLSQIMNIVRRPDAQDMYSLWKPHLKEWNINLSKSQFLDYWFSAEKENKEMINYAVHLRQQGWKLFILSNNFRERTEYYYTHFSFLKDLFLKVYFSWQTGYVKPDEKCFTYLLAEYKLDSKNCYYFDDSEKNINVAKGLGMQAYRYESVVATRKILEG